MGDIVSSYCFLVLVISLLLLVSGNNALLSFFVGGAGKQRCLVYKYIVIDFCTAMLLYNKVYCRVGLKYSMDKGDREFIRGIKKAGY